MHRTNLAAGVVFAVLGLVAIVEALRLRDDWQGAKLMPALVGAVLLVLGVLHVVVTPPPGPAWPDAPGRHRVVFAFALLVVYVALLPWLGFLLATVFLSLVMVRALGQFSWPATVGITVAIAGASHIVFVAWLGMPLPAGPFAAAAPAYAQDARGAEASDLEILVVFGA